MLRITLAAVAALFTTISVSAGSMLDDVKILDTKRQEITGSIPADDNHSTKLTNPVTGATPEGQVGRYMRLDPDVITLRQQAQDRIDCKPRRYDGMLLIGIGDLNKEVNKTTSDDMAAAEKKREKLVRDYNWPTSCALLTVLKSDDDGEYVMALTVVSPWGDLILAPFDDMWRANQLTEMTGYTVVERQHPRQRDQFVAVMD